MTDPTADSTVPPARSSKSKRGFDFNHEQPAELEKIGWKLIQDEFPKFDELESKLSGEYMVIEPRSSLDLDDQYLGQYRMGTLHRSALGAAVDSLNTIRAIIRDAGVLPMTGLYPLIRAAIENSSLAIHLIAPESRDVRLRRAYRAMAEEVDKQVRFLITMGQSEDAAKRRIRRTSEISALIEMRPTLGPPAALLKVKETHTEIVALADAAIRRDPAVTSPESLPLLAIWQLLSGMSHAKQWAMVAALERSGAIVDTDRRGAQIKMTSSSFFVGSILKRATESVEVALRYYGQRSKAAWALPEDAEEPRLRTTPDPCN